MADVTWAEAISAVGSIATPFAVAGFGLTLARRQSRSEELLKARIEYYKVLATDLNTLMCYMTFIGSWRDVSPPDVIRLKRRLDQNFYCAAPLFSDPVADAYANFERLCFSTFNRWGQDPLIVSGAYRRRQAWQGETAWDRSWDAMFTKPDTDAITAAELAGLRRGHDELVASLVRDLDLTRARGQYTTNLVSLNAHAPRPRDIEGRSP